MAASAPDENDLEGQDSNLDPEESKMEAETEQIVRGFLYTRLSSRFEQEGEEGNLSVARIPRNVLRDLRGAEQAPDNNANVALGSTLAAIGDEIQIKYKDTFQDMITQLDLTPATAYDSFAGVTRRLFSNGINWGRIVALLCFGYEIAVTVIQRGARGVSGFLKQIVRYVANFIVRERIGQWITKNGGWTALVDMTEHSANLWMMRVGVSLVVVLACVVFFNSGKKDPSL